MKRDEELKRLESYAKALGVEIKKTNRTRKDPSATWDMDGSRITLYLRKGESKTRQILLLIHELSHHKSWINRGRKESLKTHQAYSALSETTGNVLAKRHRKVIYEEEKNDTQYWDEIIREVGIEINPKKIRVEKELDIWIYREYYIKGDFPTVKATSIKRKELNDNL